MDVFSVAAGAAGVLGAYFLYLVATKGLSAAVAWVKTKWSSIEASAVSDLKTAQTTVHADIAKVKADVAAIKAKVGMV